MSFVPPWALSEGGSYESALRAVCMQSVLVDYLETARIVDAAGFPGGSNLGGCVLIKDRRESLNSAWIMCVHLQRTLLHTSLPVSR